MDGWPESTAWLRYDRRLDRWDALRALIVVAFGMLVWTALWVGGAAALATIALGALTLVAVDVHTRRVAHDVPHRTA
jgi:hypothetical protein